MVAFEDDCGPPTTAVRLCCFDVLVICEFELDVMLAFCAGSPVVDVTVLCPLSVAYVYSEPVKTSVTGVEAVRMVCVNVIGLYDSSGPEDVELALPEPDADEDADEDASDVRVSVVLSEDCACEPTAARHTSHSDRGSILSHVNHLSCRIGFPNTRRWWYARNNTAAKRKLLPTRWR